MRVVEGGGGEEQSAGGLLPIHPPWLWPVSLVMSVVCLFLVDGRSVRSFFSRGQKGTSGQCNMFVR